MHMEMITVAGEGTDSRLYICGLIAMDYTSSTGKSFLRSKDKDRIYLLQGKTESLHFVKDIDGYYASHKYNASSPLPPLRVFITHKEFDYIVDIVRAYHSFEN